MHVRSTERKAVVHQGRINHCASLGTVEQIVQVTQVSFAATHAITSTVLVQHEHLAWTEPTL